MIDLSFLQAFSIHRYVVEHFFFIDKSAMSIAV